MKSIYDSIETITYNHKIILIAVSFILGILLNEYIAEAWILIGALGMVAAVLSLLNRNLSFLLFIPLGLAFSANSQLIPENNVLNFAEETIDLEGVLYKSPESRESGTRLYLDTRNIVKDNISEQASGKVIIHSLENVESLAYGDKVRVLDVTLRPLDNYKNPGGFNLRRFYERQGIYARGFIDGEDSIISFGLAKSYSSVLHKIDTLRIRFGNYVRKTYPSPESEILNALTIGEKSAIPKEIRTEYSKAGVAHVLAISGLHVGAVAIAFFFLIKWLLKRSEYILLRYQVPGLAAAITLIPVFLYTAVAGFSTSTVRAFIMITLYLLSIVLGKEEYRANTLSAAALIILLWHPWALFEISFQLSFAAVFGILLAHRLYPFKFHTLKDKIQSLIKTTVAASLITFPIVANSFGILPLVSIPANLILVPLVEFIIVPLSLISFIGYLFSTDIGALFISINIFFIDMLNFGVESFLKIPFSSLTIPKMTPLSWIIFLLLVICIVLYSAYNKTKFIIPVLITGLVLSLTMPHLGRNSYGILEFDVLDTGPGKNIALVKLPNKKNILISESNTESDRGGYLEKTIITKYLLHKGIRKIDTLILITADKDTLSGATHLAEKFDVREILTNGDKLSGELWELINVDHIKWVDITETEHINFGKNIKFQILKPAHDYIVEDSSHSDPLAFIIEYGEFSFLVGHSLNQPEFQRELVELYGDNLSNSVLYMPHIILQEPFSKFIQFVSPNILITGNNYAQSSEIIEELVDVGQSAYILETDKDGAISISTDGEEIKLKSFSGEN